MEHVGDGHGSSVSLSLFVLMQYAKAPRRQFFNRGWII